MIERIELQDGAPTQAHETWDPHVNAVSYDRATYNSETADCGSYGDDAAQMVAERVDSIAVSQESRR